MTSENGNNYLVELQNVKKYFPIQQGLLSSIFGRGASEFVRAVDDVSFHIEKGEVFGLAGESGSGKTTVGRLALRLLEVTEGKVFFDGVECSGSSGWVSFGVEAWRCWKNWVVNGKGRDKRLVVGEWRLDQISREEHTKREEPAAMGAVLRSWKTHALIAKEDCTLCVRCGKWGRGVHRRGWLGGPCEELVEELPRESDGSVHELTRSDG